MQETERPQLKQTISGMGFFCLALGAMIGVGWITSLGGWLEEAGPIGAILAFIVGGILILFIGLCYAELTPMLPVTGGEVAYAYKALGIGKAFLTGWLLAFGYIAVCGFEAVSIGIVCSYLFPQCNTLPLYELMGQTIYLPHVLLGLLATLFIGWINYRGVSSAIKLQICLTALLAVCLIGFVLGGFVNGNVVNLEPFFAEGTGEGPWVGFLSVLVGTPFWFVGFDTIPQAAEESGSTAIMRRLGIYIVAAILAAIGFYATIILASSLSTPWPGLIGEDLPTAKAIQSAFKSTTAANVVLFAGLLGLLTSWNGFFIAGTRVLFALGRGRIIDTRFGEVHPKYGSPTKPIIFVTLLTLPAAFLGKPALIAFIDVGSFCISCAFLGVCLSFLKLRRQHPQLERPYKLPCGSVIATIAALGSAALILVMVIPNTGATLTFPLEWSILGMVLILAVLFWLMSHKVRANISKTQRDLLILDRVGENEQPED